MQHFAGHLILFSVTGILLEFAYKACCYTERKNKINQFKTHTCHAEKTVLSSFTNLVHNYDILVIQIIKNTLQVYFRPF